jgi:hypothetical protein
MVAQTPAVFLSRCCVVVNHKNATGTYKKKTNKAKVKKKNPKTPGHSNTDEYVIIHNKSERKLIGLH